MDRDTLRRVLAAVEALPEKALITGGFGKRGESHCAVGALVETPRLMGTQHSALNYAYNLDYRTSNVIVEENDRFVGSPEARYTHMVAWLKKKLEADDGEP